MLRSFTIYQGDELRVPYHFDELQGISSMQMTLLDGSQQVNQAVSLWAGSDNDGALYGEISNTQALPAGAYYLLLDAVDDDGHAARVTDKLFVLAAVPVALGWG